MNPEEKAKKFLLSLKECSLVYHSDADGVCSAALLAKLLGNKIKMVSPNDSYGIRITDRLLEEINGHESCIFVDLAVNQWDYGKIRPETLVIDHHATKKDLNREGFIHINPRIKNPETYIPASRLVYELLREMDKGMEKYAWIAAVGTLGDKGSLKGMAVSGKEDLKFLADVIEANKGVRGINGIIKCYKIFAGAQTPQDVTDSGLIKTYHRFQKALDDTETDFKYHSEHFRKKNAYLYKVYNKYKITSTLSTVLSEKEPDAAFFIYKKDKVLSMSARCQSQRINVAELMERLSRGIGTGGGHPPAAAANVPLKNSDKFMERLRNYLEGL